MTTRRIVLLGAAALLLAVVSVRLEQRGSHATGAVVASAARTPGVVNPDVTQATIGSTICVSGWTRTVRPPVDYTNALKAKQMRAYGESGSLSAYQEDHLISLELGGHPTDPRNLWPEPYPRASAVDQIENELNAKVCSGSLSLRDAQEKESALKHSEG